MAKVIINGSPLDATFSVNQGDAPDRFVITIDSGSGARRNRSARNPDYQKSFKEILARLGAIDAVVEGAYLAPKTGKLGNTRTLLEVNEHPYPWRLSRSDDFDRLRRDLAMAQQRTNSEASSGGNPTKRVELTINLRTPRSVQQLQDLLVLGLPHSGDDASIDTVNRDIATAKDEGAIPNENSIRAGIGQPYVSLTRLPSVARRDPFETDPDAVDRGNQAHALTLEQLAVFLRDNDIKPLQPNPDGPMYDLAWEDQGDGICCRSQEHHRH